MTKGSYFVMIDPISDQYNGLNATAQLIVNERALTFEELGGYIQLTIGIVGEIIGVVVGFPAVYKRRAERNRKSTVHEQIKQINEIYYSNNSVVKNREQILMKLEQKRIEVLDLLGSGSIEEDQYKMLDGKISEYEQRAGPDTMN